MVVIPAAKAVFPTGIDQSRRNRLAAGGNGRCSCGNGHAAGRPPLASRRNMAIPAGKTSIPAGKCRNQFKISSLLF
jgi:hypothetical protein